jgi:hypothetical protein
MDSTDRPPLLDRRWPRIAVRVLAGGAGILLAALLSRVAVGKFWTFAPQNFPERFPWGMTVTPGNARVFEELMGTLVLGLLIVPASQGFLMPWLRRRLSRRP